MRKFLLLISIALLFSCRENTINKFEGKWSPSERNLSYDTITISKSGNNYIAEINFVSKTNKHFIGTVNNGVLEFQINGRTIKGILDKDDNLIFGEKKSVRIE